MTDASMARPGVADDGDVGLAVGEVAAAAGDSPALARRCRSSSRGLGAICGRGCGDVGDVAVELAARGEDTCVAVGGLDVTAALGDASWEVVVRASSPA